MGQFTSNRMDYHEIPLSGYFLQIVSGPVLRKKKSNDEVV